MGKIGLIIFSIFLASRAFPCDSNDVDRIKLSMRDNRNKGVLLYYIGDGPENDISQKEIAWVVFENGRPISDAENICSGASALALKDYSNTENIPMKGFRKKLSDKSVEVTRPCFVNCAEIRCVESRNRTGACHTGCMPSQHCKIKTREWLNDALIYWEYKNTNTGRSESGSSTR